MSHQTGVQWSYRARLVQNKSSSKTTKKDAKKKGKFKLRDWTWTRAPAHSVPLSFPSSALFPSLSVGIREQRRHQRPVTTGVNGASHVCIHTHKRTHTAMRARSCNLRWGHLEIRDGGISSIENTERVLQRGLEGRPGEACVKINVTVQFLMSPRVSAHLWKGVTFNSRVL